MKSLSAVHKYVEIYPILAKSFGWVEDGIPQLGMINHKKAKGFKVGDLVVIHQQTGKGRCFVHDPAEPPVEENLHEVSHAHVTLFHMRYDQDVLNFGQKINAELSDRDPEFKNFRNDAIYPAHVELMSTIHLLRFYVGMIDLVHNDKNYALWISQTYFGNGRSTLQFSYATEKGTVSPIEIQRSINDTKPSIFVDLILEAKDRAIEQLNAMEDGTYESQIPSRDEIMALFNQ